MLFCMRHECIGPGLKKRIDAQILKPLYHERKKEP